MNKISLSFWISSALTNVLLAQDTPSRKENEQSKVQEVHVVQPERTGEQALSNALYALVSADKRFELLGQTFPDMTAEARETSPPSYRTLIEAVKQFDDYQVRIQFSVLFKDSFTKATDSKLIAVWIYSIKQMRDLANGKIDVVSPALGEPSDIEKLCKDPDNYLKNLFQLFEKAVPPVRTKNVLPTLTPEIKEALEGRGKYTSVGLTLIVNPDGTVSDPIVLDDDQNEVLSAAAKELALQWKYEPATLDGQKVTLRVQESVHFKPTRKR